MVGHVVCVLFVAVSFVFYEANASMKSQYLESRSVIRHRRSLLNDAEKEEVVKSHNEVRRKEGASNMQIMSWNDDLATMSEAWAVKCSAKHDEAFLKPPSSLGYSSAGQNLFVITNAPSFNITNITLDWYNEKSYYNYDTNSCMSGQCGHYTQVVWATSRLIGCAYSRCDTVYGDPTYPNSIVFVCDYAERGNMQGQKPFKMGTQCTECESSSSWCNRGLCDESACSPPTCQNNGTLNSERCSCDCPPNYCGSDCSSVICDAIDVRSLTMTAKATVVLSLTILWLFIL